MAGLDAEVRRRLGRGMSLGLLVLWGVGLVWGVTTVARADRVWDATGHGLVEVRHLVAELAPDTELLVVGRPPWRDLLAPIARDANRVTLVDLEERDLARAAGGGPALGDGDVQVRSGDRWLVLRRPELAEVLAGLAQVSSPVTEISPNAVLVTAADVSRARTTAALRGVDPGRGAWWVVTGLILPMAVWGAGLLLRGKRRGFQ